MATNGFDLTRFPVFQDLTPREAERLGHCITVRGYRRRELIYIPEDPKDRAFLLAEGLAKLSRLSEDGKETTLLLLGPGALFGDLAPVNGEPRETVAEALGPSLVCVLKREALADAMARNPKVALRVTEMLARRLHEVERKFEMVRRPVPARLARLLMDLALTYGREESRGIRLDVALAHQDLANQIGSTRETTTATLNAFKRRGLVSTARCQIVIRDLPRLAACA